MEQSFSMLLSLSLISFQKNQSVLPMIKHFGFLVMLFCLVSQAHAQKLHAGEVSFLMNGEKITLPLKGAELSKSNLIQISMRGEQKGDTLLLFNLNFSVKKLATGSEMFINPSLFFTLMSSQSKSGKSVQITAARDGKGLSILEKKGDKSDNQNLIAVSQKAEIKKVELKEGVLTITGEFSADYESPKEAPLVKKFTISEGKFTLVL